MASDLKGEGVTPTGPFEFLKKSHWVLYLCFAFLCWGYFSKTALQTFLSETDSYIQQFDAKELRLTKIKEDVHRLHRKISVKNGATISGLSGLGLMGVGLAANPIFGVAGVALVAGAGVAHGAAEYLVDGDAEVLKTLGDEFKKAGQPLINIIGRVRKHSKELEKYLKNPSEDLKTEHVQNSLRKILELISKVFKRTWDEMDELISDFRKIKVELLVFKEAASKREKI